VRTHIKNWGGEIAPGVAPKNAKTVL